MKDEKLEEMKLDYKNIPIPKDLKARVIGSMETAKKELDEVPQNNGSSTGEQKSGQKHNFTKNHNSGKTISFPGYIARIAGVAVAAMLVITVMANSGESIAYAMNGVPFLGAIARVVTFREYSHSQNNMEATVKVPAVSVEHTDGTPLDETTTELNQQIEAYTSQIISAYEADVAAMGGEGPESLTLDYEIVTDNDRLFTLRFDETILMAGSMRSVNIYNLDKTTGKLISLKDLFTEGSDYVTVISDSIKEQMHAQMEADENISYFYESDMPDVDFTEISEGENFYISEDGTLTLVFDKYEVAPGYMGIVEFQIPTEVIADIVKDGYVK